MIVVPTSAGEMEILDFRGHDVLYQYTLGWNGKNYKLVQLKASDQLHKLIIVYPYVEHSFLGISVWGQEVIFLDIFKFLEVET
jgi:hypothetical protein